MHQDSRVQVNGERVNGAKAGSYLKIDRKWKQGDRVEIELDLSLHYWAGEQECRNRVSIYRGPILLTYDRRLNAMDPGKIPVLEAKGLNGNPVDGEGWLPTGVEMEFAGKSGGKVWLCDFASAGDQWAEVDGGRSAAPRGGCPAAPGGDREERMRRRSTGRRPGDAGDRTAVSNLAAEALER